MRARAASRARATGRAAALALGAALAAVLALAAELALRATGIQPDAQAFPALRDGAVDVRASMFRSDRDLGYALAPGYRFKAEHAGAYALADWPWRGRSGRSLPPWVARVVVIGDSCVFGVGLDAADTLPEWLARALDERGFDATRVCVLNLGVPGFSTVQCERVLERALAELAPDACVLYVAAWNDQGPAQGRSDAAALARRPLRARSALARLLGGVRRPDLAPDEVVERWRAGAPPYGTRVPAEDVEPRIRAMLARARAEGCTPFVVAPAHPTATEREHPRVALDREAVSRAARADGAELVDAARLARETGLPDDALFLDFVHPSPLLWEAVVPPLADALAGTLSAATAPASALALRAVLPAELPSFGDARLVVELSGWTDAEPLPAIALGGAALLDLEALGGGRIAGTAPKNAPGPHDLVAQTPRGVALARAAVMLFPPALEHTPGGALACTGRPGDRAAVVLARRLRETPKYGLEGAGWLDAGTLLPEALLLELGPDGRASAPLPADAQGLFAQALVLPRGVEPGEGTEARLSAVLRL